MMTPDLIRELPMTPVARRRADASDGIYLVLGDGNRWSLPLVQAERKYSIAARGEIHEVTFCIGKPSDPVAEASYQIVLKRSITLASKGEIENRAFGIGVELGGVLLRRNYFLDDSEVETLLSLGFWKRSLEDKQAFTDAMNCYNAIQRIALDRPMADMRRMLDGPHSRGRYAEILEGCI